MRSRLRREGGQATLLMLGLLAALLAGGIVLGGFGQALGAKSRHQRAADLAAMSAAGSMAKTYSRLFEPPVFPNGTPNPRHMSTAQYEELAREAAIRAAARNGSSIEPDEVRFPAGGLAPTRVSVSLRAAAAVRVHPGAAGRRTVPVKASATAGIAAPLGTGLDQPARGHGGG